MLPVVQARAVQTPTPPSPCNPGKALGPKLPRLREAQGERIARSQRAVRFGALLSARSLRGAGSEKAAERTDLRTHPRFHTNDSLEFMIEVNPWSHSF